MNRRWTDRSLPKRRAGTRSCSASAARCSRAHRSPAPVTRGMTNHGHPLAMKVPPASIPIVKSQLCSRCMSRERIGSLMQARQVIGLVGILGERLVSTPMRRDGCRKRTESSMFQSLAQLWRFVTPNSADQERGHAIRNVVARVVHAAADAVHREQVWVLQRQSEPDRISREPRPGRLLREVHRHSVE